MVARGESATLAPGADTTLFESAPEFNMGGWTHVAAGTTGSAADRTRNRGLFRFDVAAAVPPGAVVTQVVLTLTVTRVPGRMGGGGPVASTFHLHRVLHGWGEGGKLGDRGFPADPDEATWNVPGIAGAPWAGAGGRAGEDVATASSASQFVAGKGAYAFGPSPGLVADVQRWLEAPESNFGWMLVTEAEGTAKTARGFGSREAAGAGPQLRIEFAAPAGLRLDAPERAGDGLRFEFLAQPARTYAVEATDSFEAWLTVTNYPASDSVTNRTVTVPVPGARRFFRLRSP